MDPKVYGFIECICDIYEKSMECSTKLVKDQNEKKVHALLKHEAEKELMMEQITKLKGKYHALRERTAGESTPMKQISPSSSATANKKKRRQESVLVDRTNKGSNKKAKQISSPSSSSSGTANKKRKQSVLVDLAKNRKAKGSNNKKVKPKRSYDSSDGEENTF
jgi:hypothetical protein